MQYDVAPAGIDTSEWFENVTPGFFTTLDMPPPTDKFCYAATRAFSWYPVINKRGATYFPEDISDELVQSFVGKLVNLKHEKGDIVGSIYKAAKTADGVDIIAMIDKEAAVAQGLDIEDLKENMMFSQVSIENERDLAKCRFLVIDDHHNILRTIPVLMGYSAGMSRTDSPVDPNHPYYFQGHRVVEAIIPEYFSGVAFVPNPADETAKLYAVAAADNGRDESPSGEPMATEMADAKKPYGDVHYADPGYRGGMHRYPVNDPEHVRAAAHYFGVESNRAKYSPTEREHIDSEIRSAKKRFGIGEEEAAAFSDTHADPGHDGGPKRHPLDSEENVMRAKNHFDSNRNRLKYSKEQLKAIDARVDSAMKRLGITDEDAAYQAYSDGDTNRYPGEYANSPEATASPANTEIASNMDEVIKAKDAEIARLTAELASAVEAKETASAEAAKVADLSAQVETLKTELASVTAERDEFKSKEVAREREAKVDTLCTELASIYAPETDEEKAALKETASAIVDDEGKVNLEKANRRIKALEKEVADAKKAATTEVKPNPTEQASAPEVNVLPQYGATKPSEDILALC